MLTEHFKRGEFACKCGCGFDTADYELVNLIEEMRAFFGCSVLIDSGCRCEPHNVYVGGALHSQHLLGKAADVVVEDFTAKEVYANLCDRYRGKYCFIEHRTFVHIDVREEVWRKHL